MPRASLGTEARAARRDRRRLDAVTVPFFREEGQRDVGMPGDGPPKGPPIAGAPGGGPSVFKVLGPKKIALIALAGILVGALAALVPRYLV